jgi:Na+/H+ antiporter NhaC
MLNSWFVLLPPLLVLVTVLVTQRLNVSLIIGLISAALIAGNGSLSVSASLFTKRIVSQLTDKDNLYLYAFLLILGVIIVLFEKSGAAIAFAQRLTKRLKSAKSAQTSAIMLSSSLFIDDYLSCLTTGYVMRPIMDRFAVPRAKLAYIIHSLSGPWVILAPISSWLALITSQLENAGVSPIASPLTKILADPFYIYLRSIPYIFYSLILVASVWFIVRKNLSFGPMKLHDTTAARTGNLYGGKAPISQSTISLRSEHKGSLWDLVIPLATLLITFVLGISWAGGYWLFGGTLSFLQSIQKNNQTSYALFIASIITLLVTLALGLRKKTLNISDIKASFYEGVSLMHTSVIMVFLASTLGLMMREDLQTGAYLAQILYGIISIALLPLLFYLFSIATALITGSAWGTIALMVPIAVQMVITLLNATMPAAPANVAILMPVLGAIFSGAVCGNHISPIAETTIMSANSAGCYPIDHAYTQFWYALPAILGAGISFWLTGLLIYQSAWITFGASLGIGIAFCFLYCAIAHKLARKHF